MVQAIATAAVGSCFAAADRALMVLPEARLTVLVEGDGDTPFRRYVQDRERILARWLVCRVVAISIAAVLVARVADRAGFSELVSLLLATLTAVGVYGTVAEVLLSYARRKPEAFARFALRYLRIFEWVVAPLAEPVAYLGRAIASRMPERQLVDERTTVTQVELVVQEGERAGTLANEPAEMIRNVLEFKELTAREVMVPRARIHAMEIGTAVKAAFERVTVDGHSRYPVFKETLDNVVGLVYAKDLFTVLNEDRATTTKLEQLVRSPVLYVTESQPVLTVLREMKAKRMHMAVVSDEFGGTAGLVTLEDIIEEIVGDIRDEFDLDTDAQIHELPEGRWLADAAMPITDLAQKLGREISADGDVDSIGGLIVQRSGRVPEVGASVTVDGVQLIVRDADERRVVKVEIVPPIEAPVIAS